MGYAQEIVRHLGGEWHGHYGLAPAPGHSKKDRSLKIWSHKDDPNDVSVHSFACDDVVAFKRDWRGRGWLPDRPSATGTGASVQNASEPECDADKVNDEAKRREVARWLWGQSEPAGAIIKTYLRSRGIELAARPNAIRFLPASPPKYPYPAMIVPFGIPDELDPAFTPWRPNAFKPYT